MNRISRRSAAESAEDLLEVGRTEPVLHYDVESGLARHHDWVRSDAPMPEWASASVGTAGLAPVVVKTLVSAVLIGALGTAAWYARSRSERAEAEVGSSPPGTEPAQTAAPSAAEVAASETSVVPTPIPVLDPGLPSDEPVGRAARADAPDKRITRVQRAHKEVASARAPSAAAVRRAETADATAAPVEPAPPATTEPSETVSAERTTPHEVAAGPERKPISAAREAGPEPELPAQLPDDLAEMKQVAAAERLLDRSPERALALVRQGDRLFARGYFQQERAYIAIMALIRLGRIPEARARAERFAQQFPALPYGARIRSALEAQEAAAPGAESRGTVR